MSKAVLIRLGILLSLSSWCVAQNDEVRPDGERAVAFLHQVQSALRANDSQKLAEMAQYPMLSSIHGKKVWIRTPEMFRAKYSLIFTGHTREVILGCRDSDVWGRPDDGYSIGLGILWMDARMPHGQQFPSSDSPDFWRAGAFKIITVNGAATSEHDCKAP